MNLREPTESELRGYMRERWKCPDCGWTFDEVTDTGPPDKCGECGEPRELPDDELDGA